ncbi:TD and POZ domain-containing protein 4 [Araneus ventricosus]|uniref:TD and POZ domain-containing protein 4 n=1 Tax=Araneus ventricosus TaxID=182803 RepID=A0A4Y2I6K9_ARAVE|nr:TD and POZ domain-containing protein 4 [Araneus ventricosus]
MFAKRREIQVRTRIPVETCHFKWSIENFSFYVCKVGTELTSPIFTCGTSFLTSWSLKLYPNGSRRGESEGKIGIYLTRTSTDKSAHFAAFRLSFLSVNQERHCSSDFEHLYDKPVSGFGSYDFIDRNLLLGAKRTLLLPNDILTISCELKMARVNDDLSSEGRGQYSNLPETITFSKPDSLARDLRALFDNELYSDLTIKTGEETLFVHRCILSARSSVFANMLKHKMKENLTSCLEINDVDPVVVKMMVSYIYGEQLENLTVEIAIDLYSVGERYDLKDLKTVCVNFIVSHLTTDNVCDVLLLGDLHDDIELTSAAKNFIYVNASVVQETEKWINITMQKPDLAIALYRVIVSDKKQANNFNR